MRILHVKTVEEQAKLDDYDQMSESYNKTKDTLKAMKTDYRNLENLLHERDKIINRIYEGVSNGRLTPNQVRYLFGVDEILNNKTVEYCISDILVMKELYKREGRQNMFSEKNKSCKTTVTIKPEVSKEVMFSELTPTECFMFDHYMCMKINPVIINNNIRSNVLILSRTIPTAEFSVPTHSPGDLAFFGDKTMVKPREVEIIISNLN